LKKGQGNKIITIPKKERRSSDPEKLKFLKILPLHSNLVIHAKKYSLLLGVDRQADYTGMRGHRGRLLPRGYRKVDTVEVISMGSNPI
jgi:topoisomerase-4 subunit A